MYTVVYGNRGKHEMARKKTHSICVFDRSWIQETHIQTRARAYYAAVITSDAFKVMKNVGHTNSWPQRCNYWGTGQDRGKRYCLLVYGLLRRVLNVTYYCLPSTLLAVKRWNMETPTLYSVLASVRLSTLESKAGRCGFESISGWIDRLSRHPRRF